MTNKNGFPLKKKENAEADGQNTTALKKKKRIKKSEEDTLSILSRK